MKWLAIKWYLKLAIIIMCTANILLVKNTTFHCVFFPCTSSALLAFNYCPKYSGYMVFPMHIFAVCRNYTIEGRKLFKSRNYSRKCGDLTCTYIYGQEICTTQFNTQMANGNTYTISVLYTQEFKLSHCKKVFSFIARSTAYMFVA